MPFVRAAAAVRSKPGATTGHATAEIADRRIEAVHATTLVEATTHRSCPDRIARYGQVDVTGTERLDPEWLAWMTGLMPGQIYDPRDYRTPPARSAGPPRRVPLDNVFAETDTVGRRRACCRSI